MNFSFTELPEHLAFLVSQAEPLLAAFDCQKWNLSRGEGKWTRLQLLGHLIDSAVNNNERFIRALEQPRLDWPGYNQTSHVQVQAYAAADPPVCIALWSALNRHIAHVLAQIGPEKESTPCSIDRAPEMSLAALAMDYVAHLEHHLRQLLDSVEVAYSGMPWPPADANRQWPV